MLRIPLLLVFIWCSACSSDLQPDSPPGKSLATELAERHAADSLIQDYFGREIKNLPIASLIASRDSVFNGNCTRLQELFSEQGLPKAAKIGHRGVYNFWVMVQHCDVAPHFQEEILRAMQGDSTYLLMDYRKEMAYLTDRVLKNTDRPQRYGTQFNQGSDFLLKLPPLEDSCGVDRYRLAAGMEPITEYYNNYLKWHFSVNPETYAMRKIDEPLKFTMPTDCPPSQELATEK